MPRRIRNVSKRANKLNHRLDRNLPDTHPHFDRETRTYRSTHSQALERPEAFRGKKVELLPRNLNQERYLDALQDDAKAIVIATGPAGTGKAQPLDAAVLSTSGWITMGEVKLGSRLMSSDGKEQSVIGVYPQGEKDIYRITFEDGRSTECCLDHLWQVHFWEWDSPRVIDTQEIIRLLTLNTRRDRLYVPLYQPSLSDKPANLPIDPYVLGCLIGDGCIETSLELWSADAELVEEFSSRLSGYKLNQCTKYQYQVLDNEPHKRRGKHGGYYENRLKQHLDDLGLLGHGCYTKFIPEAYFDGNTHQRCELLQGLMDTDGTCDRKTGSLSYSSSSKQLANDVQRLVWSLGGLCKIYLKSPTYTYKGEKKTGAPSFVCNIRLKDPREAFLLDRKRNLTPKNYQYADVLKLRIKNVELIGKKEAQCIMVDSRDHLYVTDNFIVTHNTLIATLYAIKQLLAGNIRKIIVTRPTVSTGEDIGFLPGGLTEKLSPWNAPILDVFKEVFAVSTVERLIATEVLELAPLGMMRGRSLKNCIMIADECQNVTVSQFLMLLTRIGENCRIIATGDERQHDRHGCDTNGLKDFVRRLQQHGYSNAIAVCEFTAKDVERHPVIEEILSLYDDR